jgi:hypothetical protein
MCYCFPRLFQYFILAHSSHVAWHRSLRCVFTLLRLKEIQQLNLNSLVVDFLSDTFVSTFPAFFVTVLTVVDNVVNNTVTVKLIRISFDFND